MQDLEARIRSAIARIEGRDHGLTWSPLDVDADPELRARFTDVVPVLLRDGRPVAKIRTDRRSLERIVRRRRDGES